MASFCEKAISSATVFLRHDNPSMMNFVHGNEAAEQEKAELYQQIGKLQVELDWLQKKSGILRR